MQFQVLVTLDRKSEILYLISYNIDKHFMIKFILNLTQTKITKLIYFHHSLFGKTLLKYSSRLMSSFASFGSGLFGIDTSAVN